MEDSDDYDRDDCKLEGGAIGREGASVVLGQRSVALRNWIPKADSPGEYVGFDAVTSDGRAVSYVVKAGGERWQSTDSSWMHPLGNSGPDVPGISNVDFCDECEDGDCPPPGGDDGCNDPDGCDPGDGGTCNDPDGCDPGDGDTCTDPEGCEPPECSSDEDCASGEFCEGGACLPVIK